MSQAVHVIEALIDLGMDLRHGVFGSHTYCLYFRKKVLRAELFSSRKDKFLCYACVRWAMGESRTVRVDPRN